MQGQLRLQREIIFQKTKQIKSQRLVVEPVFNMPKVLSYS